MRARRLMLLLVILATLAGGVADIVAGQAAPSAPAGFVTRHGDGLLRDGRSFRFTGVNAYQLATDYAVNRGCGTQPSGPDALLGTLPPGSVVRLWAFHPFATSVHGGFAWGPLDAVVRDAQRRGVLLVLTLSDQGGTCDDGRWHDAAWYRGGYRTSFEPWVRAVVARYASSPAVAAWEPVNEPEASDCDPGYAGTACATHHTCRPGAAQALRGFFDAIGAEIHHLDRWHPVATGMIGGDQCGVAGAGFALLAGSPGVDVLTVHDYAIDDDSWVTERAAEAVRLGKPLVDEETGLAAGTGD